jgi:hypothetical protein
MRRIMLVTAIACAAVGVLAWPGMAKGFEEHAHVVIRGPGLGDPIRLSGEDAFVFVTRSGAGQPKWDVPNIGGTLTPDAELGTAYRAVVRLPCGGGKTAAYRQTLFPEAPGGLQVLTPPGAKQCYGGVAMPGYWPAADELLVLLVNRGLPDASANQAPTNERASPAGAAAGEGSGGGSFGAGLAITVALVAAIALLGSVAMIASRRRRGTA